VWVPFHERTTTVMRLLPGGLACAPAPGCRHSQLRRCGSPNARTSSDDPAAGRRRPPAALVDEPESPSPSPREPPPSFFRRRPYRFSRREPSATPASLLEAWSSASAWPVSAPRSCAAVRLLAPWVGASTIRVGQHHRHRPRRALSIGTPIRRPAGGTATPTMKRARALGSVASAAPLALVPFVSGPAPASVTKRSPKLSRWLFVGSLPGVGVLIAVPVLLLAMVSPYAVRPLRVDQFERDRRARAPFGSTRSARCGS